MSGSIDVDISGSELGIQAVPITVFRYDPDGSGDDRFQSLPNVQCEAIERQVGAHPSTARFRYILDHSIEDPPWPTQFDELLPVDAAGPYVVRNDDRVVVVAWTPEGDRRVLFDGFAQIPQVNVSPGGQAATFAATGVECRCWDVPIGGRIQRDADDPEAGTDIQTDLPTRFNPSDGRGGIIPNCTPDDSDVNQGQPEDAYPVFLDERITRTPEVREYWTVSRAARYILGVHNDPNADTVYVLNPNLADMATLLVTKVPTADDGDGVVDFWDPGTYLAAEVPVRDLDVTNQPWPEAFQRLIARVGYRFCFDVEADSTGAPVTYIRIFPTEGSTQRPKTLRLGEFRDAIDPAANNVASISMSRDSNAIVNAFSVTTYPRRVEVSIVLAMGFTPTAGDGADGTRQQFLNSRRRGGTLAVQRGYRYYVADEAGEGHWDGASFVTGEALDLSAVFPDDEDDDRTYVNRLRPGSRHLISLDDAGQPRKAMLHYSQDYAGDYPAVWDGSGTWTEITKGWAILDDRIGIEVSIEDPEKWVIGNEKAALSAISWQADAVAGKQFWLRLTTVIDDDIMLASVVPARESSPTQFERRRRIDARDHFVLHELAPWSQFNQTADKVTVRDDTEKALALARQYRAANEMAPFSGSAVIPYLTNYYQLGDRISGIKGGRDVSFRTNAKAEAGEGARYPFVVKYSFTPLLDRQSTTIHLSDLRAEPRE